MQQAKFEQAEQLIENSDNQKREIREIKYAIDKNNGDIETINSSIKSLKRREVTTTKETPLPSQVDNSKILLSVEKKIDDKLEDGLARFKQLIKNELKNEYQNYTDDSIKENNKRIIVPTIDKQISDAFDRNKVVEKNKFEVKSAAPLSAEPNREIDENMINKKVGIECRKIFNEMMPECQTSIERNLSKNCKSIIKNDVPLICRDIIDTEAQIVCKEILEKEIEPTCRHIMIEEYARTRRNIVDKEIQPACKAIIDEEVPSMCERLVSKEFNRTRDFVLKQELFPTCKEIIDEEMPASVRHIVEEETQKIKQELLDYKIEPICRNIINNEVDYKCRTIINNDIETLCRNAVKDELDTWAEREMHFQEEVKVLSQISPRMHLNKKSNVQSAKQLPINIMKIEESPGEESPEALPKHHMPPTSYVDARSSILQSEASNLEAYSQEDNRFRYSAEPHGTRSRIFKNKSKDNELFRNNGERLKDYLKDKFRPPSDSRSAENERSSRSLSNSKANYQTPNLKPALQHQIVSFGRSNLNNEYSFNDANHSSSLEQYSNEKYNFMDKISDKKSTKKLNFNNSLGNYSIEDSEQRINPYIKSKAQTGFTFEKLPKYHPNYQYQTDSPNNNKIFSPSGYMEMQDVINENNKYKIKHKGL